MATNAIAVGKFCMAVSIIMVFAICAFLFRITQAKRNEMLMTATGTTAETANTFQSALRKRQRVRLMTITAEHTPNTAAT